MKIGIDFCIIDNPFNTSEKSNLLVFITQEGLEHLEDGIKDSEGYKTVVSELKKLGYLETDNFRFEFIQNEEVKEEPEEGIIITILEKLGATYSDKLENALYKDFDQLKDNIDLDFINSLIKEAEQVTYDSSIDEAFVKLHNSKDEQVTEIPEEVKSKDLPKIREFIELNLYLFVDIFFKEEDDFVADISGDFMKEHSNLSPGMFRSMVKIFTDSFKRVNYTKNPNVVELVSTKTKREILKEIGFLYDVAIDVVKAQKFNDKKFLIENEPKYYNILSLREKMGNLEECVYFEISVKDYHKMLTKSNNIGQEKENKQINEIIEVDEVLDECYFFIETIDKDIKVCADEEDFEEALLLKEISDSLKTKVEIFKEEIGDKDLISIEEFHSKLSSDI